MRKIALIVAMLFITSYASAGLIPKFRYGVKAGVDYQANDFKSAINNFDIKSSTGWFAGAMLDLKWGKLGVHPEVLYSQNKFDITGADGSLKINQIDAPVLLNYGILGLLDIQVGPRFCVMEKTAGETKNVQWNWSSPTVGYAVGLETSIWKLAISARFNGSFKKSEVMGFTTGSSRTNKFQIGVGYYF
ncbi:MAG: outer membrane beta-barrel protein [Alistipes sp.]|nr:outer membrane beta-barrel protein [Alistipes sp.]